MATATPARPTRTTTANGRANGPTGVPANGRVNGSTNGRAGASAYMVIRCKRCREEILDDDVRGHAIDTTTHQHYHGPCAVAALKPGTQLRTLSGALLELLAEDHPIHGRWRPVARGPLSERQTPEWARLRAAGALLGPRSGTPAVMANGAPTTAPTAFAITTNGAPALVDLSDRARSDAVERALDRRIETQLDRRHAGPAKTGALVPINRPGQRTLAQLEQIVGANLAAFMHAGQALAEIRDRRLYLEQMFHSFEEYCQARWAFTRRHGDRLIEAHQVVGVIAGGQADGRSDQVGLTTLAELVPSMARVAPPLNEAQARELAPLLDRPDELRATWRAVLDEVRLSPKSKPSAKLIREVVVRRHRSPHDERQQRLRDQAAFNVQRFTRAGLPFGRIEIADARRFQDRLPDACINVIATSPGYWGKGVYGAGPDEVGNEPSPKAYLAHVLEKLEPAARVLVDGGWLFLVLGDTYLRQPGGYRGDPDRQRTIGGKARHFTSLAPTKRTYDGPEGSLALIPWTVAGAIVYELGLALRNVICWRKQHHKPANTLTRLTEAWEPVFAFCKGPHPYFNRARGDSRAVDVWDIAEAAPEGPEGQEGQGGQIVWEIPVGRPGVRTDHPAVFPDALVERIFDRVAPPDGIVADFFAGSGTVLDVAKKRGLKALGCDLVDWSTRRPAGLPLAEAAGG